ncbi:glycoside hydrolase superfamily [Tribonema minus]|uniref:Glycoside hydrolase superfamily n=1 Tax=Tribonema minus TaxID=303371 RepID=A0A835YLQ0_9STRA|nr:glycoside hydrolase superfamily [Tribonema minus]
MSNPPRVGVTTDTVDINDLEDEVNAKLQNVNIYQDVRKLADAWEWIPPLDDHKGVSMVMEFQDAKLQDILDGKFDSDMKNVAKVAKEDGRRVWMRPLHEFNSDWYSWGTYRDGFEKVNTRDQFKKAFRKIVTLFRQEGATNLRWQLSYNNNSPKDDPRPFSEWWPGRDVVDMVTCSAYNRAGIDSYHKDFKSFDEVYGPAYDRMKKLDKTVKLGVGETSTSGVGGSRSDWFYGAFKSIADGHYPRMRLINFFLENKDMDWRLNTQSEKDAFGRGLRLLRP